jgi:hypothetical protein
VWVAGRHYNNQNFKSKLYRKQIKEKMTLRQPTWPPGESKE